MDREFESRLGVNSRGTAVQTLFSLLNSPSTMRMTHCRRSTANTAAPSVNINHSHLGSIENSRQLKMSDWRLARASVHKNMLEIPTQTTKIMLHLWLLRYKSATLRNNARPSATQTCSAYQPYRIWQHFDYNHTKPTLATTERGTYALVLPTPSWNPPSSSTNTSSPHYSSCNSRIPLPSTEPATQRSTRVCAITLLINWCRSKNKCFTRLRA